MLHAYTLCICLTNTSAYYDPDVVQKGRGYLLHFIVASSETEQEIK